MVLSQIGEMKMNMQDLIKMAIEAYCEISGESYEYVLNECRTNYEGPVNQSVLMLMFAAR